jgi:succinoglycan biosynthesis protein ExoM
VTSAITRRVTIAVLTYRRPDDLAAGLPMLVTQAESAAGGGPPGTGYLVEVLVVDNDAAGSAAAVVDALGSSSVRYVVEPEPGIAAARNRALDEAGQADLLVFIDDDERPHEGWLRNLLETNARTGAAAVAGAVVSEFETDPDPWLAAGEFFRRRRLKTGTRIDVAATNNLLLDLAAVRRLGLRFDVDFGLTGGEDTLFTRALARGGETMVWCDEAIVTDWVPAARLTRRWVLQRAVSTGNTVTRVAIRQASGPVEVVTARLTPLARALPRMAGGLARYLYGRLARSDAHQAHGLRTLARGVGMAGGAIGYRHQEYRRD